MKIQPIETAPKNGRWIKLHRRKGDTHNGRWGTKRSLFRFGHQWISDSDKFLDVLVNKVVGWTEI